MYYYCFIQQQYNYPKPMQYAKIIADTYEFAVAAL
jgi:hypothetical protein